MNDGITAYVALWESPYFGTLAIILVNAKVGTFPLSYAVIPSFISCFTTFYCIDPYFIFKLKNSSNVSIRNIRNFKFD